MRVQIKTLLLLLLLLLVRNKEHLQKTITNQLTTTEQIKETYKYLQNKVYFDGFIQQSNLFNNYSNN